jgi:glycosyltransferase involved in cell wall biosynthesis
MDKMKTVGFICVYNDADYLEQCILSCKDHVDELMIIEGAFQCTLFTDGKRNKRPERSNDGTLDIIAKYVDNKKIHSAYANEKEHKYQYQIGLDFAKERNADWAILIDSDEVWTQQAWSLLNTKLKTADKFGVYEYRIKEYCFINDFNTWYPGEYPRVFKVTPDAYFVADNEVVWTKDGKHEDRGRAEGHIQLLSNSPIVYHYGYVRRKKRWQLKQDCLWEKDHNPINKQYKLEANTYVIPSDIPIYSFTGKHPEIMQKHEFHNKTANEIIYGEEE